MSSEHQNGSGKKLTDALELLNEAAREKKNEIRNLISDRYSDIQKAMKDTVEEVVTEGKRSVKKAKMRAQDVLEEGEVKIEKTVRQVDKAVRKDPWKFIGGAALSALVVGLFLGKKK